MEFLNNENFIEWQISVLNNFVLICCFHKFSFYWVLCSSTFFEGKDGFWCQDWKRANNDNNNNSGNNNNNNIQDTSSKNFCWRHFYDFFYLLSAPFFLVNLMSQIDDMCTPAVDTARCRAVFSTINYDINALYRVLILYFLYM